MAKGNPNPNLDNLTPFKKGQSGNPKGNTSEAWVKRRANAEKAEIVHAWFLASLEKISECMSDENRIELLKHPKVLDLTKDAMDRYYGKAGQQLDLLSSDGSQGPSVVRLIAATEPQDDDDS